MVAQAHILEKMFGINMGAVQMADTHLGFFQACDGLRLRYGFWPGVGDTHKGVAVILGGRTEFMEKYAETIGEVNSRGFDAFSLDWRGQGFSDRMLTNPTLGYIQSFKQYVDDLAQFLEQIVRPNCSGSLIILSHSMGGHIVLHYLRKFPHLIDKGVLLSPMINIRTAPVPKVIARWSCRLQVRLGKADRSIPSLRRNDSFHGSFANNWLTHDSKRFHNVQRLLRENPQLSVSSVTYGWLDASFRAIGALKQPEFARCITTPLLIVTAGDDRVVSNDAIRRFAAQLPVHQSVCIKGAYHEILQERDDLRSQFWYAFDRFVQA